MEPQGRMIGWLDSDELVDFEARRLAIVHERICMNISCLNVFSKLNAGAGRE